jgi:hypothetical protein
MHACAESLRDIFFADDTTQIELMRKTPPWHLLLIIKWAIAYGDNLSPNRRKLTEDDFIKLYNLFHDMSGRVRSLDDYESPYIFFRNLSFQQFWLQENYALSRLSRQSLLFGRLANEHTFNKWFFANSHITVQQFIELAVMLITKFISDENLVITNRWFESVRASYPEDSINYLFSTLSRDYYSIREFLQDSDDKYGNILYEYYEQSPLKKYPLLKMEEGYYCYSIQLLLHSMQTYIYDTLRNHNPNPSLFMDRFGPIFESFVAKGLEYADLTFLREKDLASHLPAGKLVDFLIVEGDCNVFVDAKGVEMSYLGMVDHRPDVIRDKTKTSILKGIEQGLSTAMLISNVDRINDIKLGKKRNYLIIVTYKDLYIGNGTIFYDVFAKEKLDKIIEEYGNEQLIPFENMYFMSIDDFDMMMAQLKRNESHLIKLLESAVLADRDPKTSKFLFRQHLQERNAYLDPARPDVEKMPEYIVAEFEDISERCIQRIHNAKMTNK